MKDLFLSQSLGINTLNDYESSVWMSCRMKRRLQKWLLILIIAMSSEARATVLYVRFSSNEIVRRGHQLSEQIRTSPLHLFALCITLPAAGQRFPSLT